MWYVAERILWPPPYVALHEVQHFQFSSSSNEADNSEKDLKLLLFAPRLLLIVHLTATTRQIV